MTEVISLHENNKRFGQSDRNLTLQAAELAVVGEVLSTLGDTISTISTVLALEAELQQQNEKENDKKDNKDMQKQIDYLTTELENLKNQVNRHYPRGR
ncbi:hypothetical protein [Lysinibacillus parviboronicapiens]|uniref:hypothetical protein n=1 Tax=Lysinibacillus parviboronicapiens TaxID=436516 RepID=UPI001EE7203C|nr:hypothetical protein [Lysinibacillus parviboronicapiens]